jgi:hypothetical protein
MSGRERTGSGVPAPVRVLVLLGLVACSSPPLTTLATATWRGRLGGPRPPPLTSPIVVAEVEQPGAGLWPDELSRARRAAIERLRALGAVVADEADVLAALAADDPRECSSSPPPVERLRRAFPGGSVVTVELRRDALALVARPEGDVHLGPVPFVAGDLPGSIAQLAPVTDAPDTWTLESAASLPAATQVIAEAGPWGRRGAADTLPAITCAVDGPGDDPPEILVELARDGSLARCEGARRDLPEPRALRCVCTQLEDAAPFATADGPRRARLRQPSLQAGLRVRVLGLPRDHLLAVERLSPHQLVACLGGHLPAAELVITVDLDARGMAVAARARWPAGLLESARACLLDHLMGASFPCPPGGPQSIVVAIGEPPP